jgi:hypothetical protein
MLLSKFDAAFFSDPPFYDSDLSVTMTSQRGDGTAGVGLQSAALPRCGQAYHETRKRSA